MRVRIVLSVGVGITIAAILGWWGLNARYGAADAMTIPVESVLEGQYTADPTAHSRFYSRYVNRHLTLLQQDERHYDFVFDSLDPHVATIALSTIDLGLFVPCIPPWLQSRDLEAITLSARERTRQQVVFSPTSPHLNVEGGDGFESRHLHSIELVRNSLQAGLWEIQLYTMEEGHKALLYHGWFTLPLGVYKRIFESINQRSYWGYSWRLEHWVDPEGIPVALDRLRIMTNQRQLFCEHDPCEQVPVTQEQEEKASLLDTTLMQCWADFPRHSEQIRFPTFAPPGRYDCNKPWNNAYYRLAKLRGALLRRVLPANGAPEKDEIELVFESEETVTTRILISGFDLASLPRAEARDYTAGWAMPFGVSVHPIVQTYEDLQNHPPPTDSYFGLLLDEENRWINHQTVALDGVILFHDHQKKDRLHVYLLSYERYRLVGHYILKLEE